MAPRAQVYHNLLPTTTLPTPAGLVCDLASDEALTPKWHTPLLLASASAAAAAAAAAASDAAGAAGAAGAHQRQSTRAWRKKKRHGKSMRSCRSKPKRNWNVMLCRYFFGSCPFPPIFPPLSLSSLLYPSQPKMQHAVGS
ncbi:hypothetical protein LY76DRAFT_10086 [Colletotrichum caudatum]|nr:hypothetical protein LY76DRAFT_10086 [Colletotrichum caudatum]